MINKIIESQFTGLLLNKNASGKILINHSEKIVEVFVLQL